MGSGQSSEVKNIQIEQRKSDGKNDRKSKSKQERSKPEFSKKDEEVKEVKEDGASVNNDKDEQLQTLEKQLIESESQRLDLEDRVQTLEEQLQYADQQNLMTEEKPCDETLTLKTQQITRLELEKTELRTELNKWKQKHKRKVKALTSQLKEQRLETNFQMMELREETERLLDDNTKLEGLSSTNKSTEDSARFTVAGMTTTTTTAGDRLKVILELSSQLEEQNKRVADLENQLAEKDHIVKELRVKLKNNAEYLKIRDGSDSQKMSPVKSSLPGPAPHQSMSSSRITSRDIADKVDPIDSLFSMDDDEEEESRSMSKLSSLLRGASFTRDKGLPVIRESYELKDESEPMEKEIRSVSGSSGDSGLGSAGKRESSKINIVSDWPERSSSRASLESGISDSDFERDYASHSKIASAPPKLQNGGGQRLKKKSNSLKKRSSEKEPFRPKPSIAFEENSDLPQNSHLLLTQKMSHGISPVHVS